MSCESGEHQWFPCCWECFWFLYHRHIRQQLLHGPILPVLWDPGKEFHLLHLYCWKRE